GDQSVCHTVASIADSERRVRYYWPLFGRDKFGGAEPVLERRHRVINVGRLLVRPVIHWGAYRDAVIVFWMCQRFLESLLARRRTSAPISTLGRDAIISLGDGFALDGHFMNRAIDKIRQLFRVTECPACVVSSAFMSRVGRNRGIAALDTVQQFA